MNRAKIGLNIVFSTFLFSILGFNFVSADDRDLPGIDLITRSERGADESWRYIDRPEYQAMIAAREAEAERIEQLKIDDYEAYLEIKRAQYEKDMANDYLATNFADEYSFDEVREYYNGHELRMPEYIANNKTKIIIHHSAADSSELTSQTAVLEYLKKTYKYHALVKGRGDIGYNFIIDPQGNIYEGRAGGEGAVGMHAKRNNTPSLGIMLMGNFEYQEPTDAQMESLEKLVSVLAAKYGINPNEKTYYHMDSSSAPYLKTVSDYKVAGHKDAGYTACPGANLYAEFGDLRRAVAANLLRADLIQDTRKIIKLSKIFFADTSSLTIQTDLRFDDLNYCKTESEGISVESCDIQDGILTMKIRKTTGKGSGVKTIVLKNKSGEQKSVVAIMLRQSDLDPLLTNLKNNFIRKSSLLSALVSKNKEKNIQKITHQITQSEARQLLEQKISVLLYELSTQFSQRIVSCDGECAVLIDDKIYHTMQTIITAYDGQYHIQFDDKNIDADSLEIYSANGDILKVENYMRQSYAGVPWNTFRGMLSFQQEEVLTDKINGTFEKSFAVIDILDFDDYMKGIVESNDTETDAKNEAMSVVARTYALFYLHPENLHPSIPSGVSYNAVDDPDLFQKFVGEGLESTLHKRYQALEKTQNQVVFYNDFVPILPYFHCSPGFTLTAQEKRGRSDTDYLQSRLDVSGCTSFDGHGVGMSGKGAERRAKHGFDYEQLIKYYYEGVEIVTL